MAAVSVQIAFSGWKIASSTIEFKNSKVLVVLLVAELKMTKQQKFVSTFHTNNFVALFTRAYPYFILRLVKV